MRIEVISEMLLHKIANAKKDACLVRGRWNRIKRIHEDAVRENVMEKEYRRKRVYKKSCKGSHVNFIYIQLGGSASTPHNVRTGYLDEYMIIADNVACSIAPGTRK